MTTNSQPKPPSSKKYGYIGIGTNGIYRGVFQSRPESGYVPSLAALAIVKIKGCALLHTTSGLSLVPSTLKHSSILVKRGQLDHIESKKLRSSTSSPTLTGSSYPDISQLRKNKSCLDLTQKTTSVHIKKKARKNRRVSFLDECVSTNVSGSTCSFGPVAGIKYYYDSSPARKAVSRTKKSSKQVGHARRPGPITGANKVKPATKA